jgi:hypothetical protein
MRITARRKDDGQPLRAAMKAAGMNLQKLATATKIADMTGIGVSYQLIGFLATAKKYGRSTTTPETALLIERALGCAEGALFDRVEMPGREAQPEWEAL